MRKTALCIYSNSQVLEQSFHCLISTVFLYTYLDGSAGSRLRVEHLLFLNGKYNTSHS